MGGWEGFFFLFTSCIMASFGMARSFALIPKLLFTRYITIRRTLFEFESISKLFSQFFYLFQSYLNQYNDFGGEQWVQILVLQKYRVQLSDSKILGPCALQILS